MAAAIEPGKAPRQIAGLLRRAGQVERWIAMLAFLMLVAVLFADVVSRELTGSGLIWARQLGVYANLVITLVGLGVASAQGAHLRPRFADRWLPNAWNPAIERLQEALMAGFCAAFAIVAIVAVMETQALAERTAMPPWPVWPFQALIPLAFSAAGVRHALFAAWPGLRPDARHQVSPPGPAAGADGREAR